MQCRGGGGASLPTARHSPQPHLQQHVAWLDAAIGRHGPALHDGADVDAAVPAVVALAHDADAQEVVPFCEGNSEQPSPESPSRPRATEASPMLSVTVMMFRDMVESVTLLKEEACKGHLVRGPGRAHRPAPPPAAATYAVRLPQALLPPPPLVLPDEP